MSGASITQIGQVQLVVAHLGTSRLPYQEKADQLKEHMPNGETRDENPDEQAEDSSRPMEIQAMVVDLLCTLAKGQ